jgi:hypothetical protein
MCGNNYVYLFIKLLHVLGLQVLQNVQDCVEKEQLVQILEKKTANNYSFHFQVFSLIAFTSKILLLQSSASYFIRLQIH